MPTTHATYAASPRGTDGEDAGSDYDENPQQRRGQPRSSSAGRLVSPSYNGLYSARSGRVSLDSTMGGKRDPAEMGEFRIVVAARIRPFTAMEVQQWQQERRLVADDVHDDNSAGRAANGGGGPLVRPSSRQPFGLEYKSLNSTVVTSSGQANAGSPHDVGMLVGDRLPPPSCDSAAKLPLPVVEVEGDGRTIALLDAQHLPSDELTTAPVRKAFTYDHVFSSFAPGFEYDAQLPPGGQGDAKSSATSPSSRARMRGNYIIVDSDDASSSGRSPMVGVFANTAEQEELAEAEQVAIFKKLAVPLVDHALQGYNTCMFAYGQTGSGKTYTMMGSARHPGLVPRLCELLFSKVEGHNAQHDASSPCSPTSDASSTGLIALHLSYLEIYNEQVRDLLKQRPKNTVVRYRSRFDTKDIDGEDAKHLKVRHHPSRGIYVEGLTTVAVQTWAECKELLMYGHALRAQGCTAMNAKSSRSHAICQFQLVRREGAGGRVRGREVALETASKINLVDLAGSERNAPAKTGGKHLAEATSINVSLSTLRRVLDALVNNHGLGGNVGSSTGASSTPSTARGNGTGKGRSIAVIPYRESLLTYVLSENLGGNSFTVMCANVSPSASNINETESTLRYATVARSVVNHAKLNEAPTARIIREMREQIKSMQRTLHTARDASHVAKLEQNLSTSEQLVREMRKREESYEARLRLNAEKHKKLLDTVAKHQASEEYWRGEALRQREAASALRSHLKEKGLELPATLAERQPSVREPTTEKVNPKPLEPVPRLVMPSDGGNLPTLPKRVSAASQNNSPIAKKAVAPAANESNTTRGRAEQAKTNLSNGSGGGAVGAQTKAGAARQPSTLLPTPHPTAVTPHAARGGAPPSSGAALPLLPRAGSNAPEINGRSAAIPASSRATAAAAGGGETSGVGGGGGGVAQLKNLNLPPNRLSPQKVTLPSLQQPQKASPVLPASPPASTLLQNRRRSSRIGGEGHDAPHTEAGKVDVASPLPARNRKPLRDTAAKPVASEPEKSGDSEERRVIPQARASGQPRPPHESAVSPAGGISAAPYTPSPAAGRVSQQTGAQPSPGSGVAASSAAKNEGALVSRPSVDVAGGAADRHLPVMPKNGFAAGKPNDQHLGNASYGSKPKALGNDKSFPHRHDVNASPVNGAQSPDRIDASQLSRVAAQMAALAVAAPISSKGDLLVSPLQKAPKPISGPTDLADSHLELAKGRHYSTVDYLTP